MIKRRLLLFIMAGFMLVAALALWPGRWLQSAYANVTLVSFTATSLPGQPEIYIVWETATEFDTVGFFIARSDSASGEFTRISDFIQHAGDTVVGAQYGYIDENTVLNQAYYYRLEVLNTDQSVDYHGPIRAVAGVPATETPTVTATPTPSRTPTRTPTFTPSPTATPTTPGGATMTTNSTTGAAVVTPRVAAGATVTPRATSAGSPANPVEPTVAPPLFTGTNETQTSSAIATPDLSSSNLPTVETAAPPPSASVDVGQAIAPTLAPVDAGAALAAPVVITPAPTPSAAASSVNIAPLVLLAAALLFLGIAFVILRQAGR